MHVNEDRIKRRLETLAQFTSTPGQGTTRMSYSEEARKTRAYLKEEMAAIGLSVREDAIGNVFGRMEGSEDLPPVMIGSHFDSVPYGGPFDGPAGVVAALETATCFYEQKLAPRYPLEVVAMVEEEGGSFGSGLLASRAMAGSVSAQDVEQLKDASGVSAAQRMRNAGYQPEAISSLVRPKGSIKAFLELHIEQGPILENAGEDIGLVDVVVGISQSFLTVKGQAGHAGTTPMDQRSDALLFCSTLIQDVARWAKEAGEGTVATVGRLSVYPNGANIIPEEVTLTVDIRSKNEEKMQWVLEQLRQWVAGPHPKGISCSWQQMICVPPTKMNPAIHEQLVQNSRKFGLKYRSMASGAGHDAMIFATFTDVGLIFVPSKAGLSHHPDEWTDYAQLAIGANVMFETVKGLTEAK